MPVSGKFAIPLLAIAFALPVAAQQPKPAPESAQQLARDVVWNELHDRERDSHWEYLSDRSANGQDRVTEQVETTRGPVFRTLELDGSPLTASQQHQEIQRIQDYIHDPSAVARIQRDHQQDEDRLASIMRMLPAAFLYRYLGAPSGDVLKLGFRPNPAFSPSGYEARVVHSLTGTMTVDLRCKRLIDIRGVVSQQLDFGFGLLGHVDQGSTFEVHRVQVSTRHWKTDLVNIDVQGKLLLFKTVAKNEREVRSGFHAVSENLTLVQAGHILSQAAADPAVLAELASMPGSQSASNPDSSVNSDQ
jgi:hypothetical protein